MLFRKITEGAVVQVFNDAGEFVGQRFFAGDNVEYETSDGDPINLMDMPLGGNEYQPFEMQGPAVTNQEIESALQLNVE